MKCSPRFVIVVTALYAVTWVGGYYTHKRGLARYAQRLYTEAQVFEREQTEFNIQEGIATPRRITLDGGPFTKVKWCFPVLPGILLTDSYYVVGPLFARGGISVLLYYGLGCLQLGPIWGWIS